MKIRIYVMTHKKFRCPSELVYYPLHVGRAEADDLGYPGDDTGDNISEWNSLFGELTGIYWVWKNDWESDTIGICHYRRYFKEKGSTVLLGGEQYAEIMESYDVMTSDLQHGEVSCKEGYAKAHNLHDLLEVKKSVQRLFPEYSQTFRDVFNGKDAYYGNLMVMHRELFAEYCNWLFLILFDASEHIDVTGYDLYHRRVYGFLSENLLRVWVLQNRLRVYEGEIGYTAEKAETVELKRAIASLVKEHRITKARELFYQITEVRPDVQLAGSDLRGEMPLIEQILFLMERERDQGVERLLGRSDDLEELLRIYRALGASIESYEERMRYVE